MQKSNTPTFNECWGVFLYKNIENNQND